MSAQRDGAVTILKSSLPGAIIAKLASSCLTPEDGKAMRIKLANPEELAGWSFPKKQAMEMPYFEANGKLTGYRRFRYLEDTRDGFAAQTAAKPLRYVQPPGSLQGLYLPPFCDWQAIQRDASLPIIITEGELKAACCSKLYAPCIGLGGVNSYKSAKRKQPLLNDFLQFAWRGRKLIVAYDSDARKNHQVVAARNGLCHELLLLGGLPYIADLEPGEDGGKRGLDDIAMQEGPEGLADALASAEPYAACAALHELNAEVAYVRDPGLIVVLDSGLRMRASDFTSHAYANRHFHKTIFDKEGHEKLREERAAPAWLEWPKRRELSRIEYAPGESQITPTEGFNSWPGWACEPKRGSVAMWRWLLGHLFGRDTEAQSWFERWCALPLQRPGAKMYTAAVMWGVRTGTGKSLVGQTLSRIYGKNYALIGDAQLQDQRNEWAQSKQFVMGDDVTGHEQRKYADRLKAMITQETMRIDPKYVPSYSVRDCINYFFTSNHPDAFFLEDDDRRFWVYEIQAAPADRHLYKEYMAWLEGGGAEALFYHLQHLPLHGMEPEDRAPHTSSRASMIEDGLSDLGRWVRKLRDDPIRALRIGDAPIAGDLWTAQDLLRLYDPEGKGRATAGGMGKELKRAGMRQAYGGMPLKTETAGQVRLFAVRNEEIWLPAKSKALIEHYDARRAAGVAREKKF